MNKKRCPWCGKIIDYASDRKNVIKKKTPRYLLFARCGHCHNYYGQTTNSKRMTMCFCGIGLLVLMGVAFDNIIPMILSVFLILFASFGPLEKMNENEEKIISDKFPQLKIIVLETYSGFRRNEYYFLTDLFDNMPCFSVVSPIRILSFDKRDNKLLACFLYDHCQNIEYMDKDIVNVYNSKKKLVAKIKFIK